MGVDDGAHAPLSCKCLLRRYLPEPALHALLFQCVVHPKGLDPFQAAKAWHLRMQEGSPWKEVRARVHTMTGERPGQDAVEDAVQRVEPQRNTAEFRRTGAVKSGLTNHDRTA